MGNDQSTEKKAVSKVLDLRRDPSKWREVIEEFNRIVPPDYDAKCEDKRVLEVVITLLQKQFTENTSDYRGTINLLETARRLLRFKGLYKALPKLTVGPFVQCLSSDKPEVIETVLNTIRNIVEFTGHTKKEEVKTSMEAQVREKFFQQNGYEVLLDVLKRFGRSDRWIITASTLRIFSMVLSLNTKSSTAENVTSTVELLRRQADLILELSYDANPDICYYGILCTQVIILHSEASYTQQLQSRALNNGTLLRHFFIAVNGEKALRARKQVGDNAKAIVAECRNLVGLLTDGHPKSSGTLQRCLPSHLLERLKLPHPYPSNFTFWKSRTYSSNSSHTTWMLYQKGRPRANWIAVFNEIDKEHRLPHLIWNETTRGELIRCLSTELRDLDSQQKRDKLAIWDFEGFEVQYESIEAELEVKGYYLRMLLPEIQDPNSTYKINPNELRSIISGLYDHAVIEDNPTWKLACLRTMSALYALYAEDVQDALPLPYLVWLMSPKHARPMWRDHILLFFTALLKHPPNARRFIQTGGVDYLVTYMAQAHSGVEERLQGRRISDVPEYAQAVTTNPITTTTGIVADVECTSLQSMAECSVDSILDDVPEQMKNGKISDLCIDLLDTLLDRIPRLRKSISKSESFQILLQFLLSPDRHQAVRVMPLLLKVCDASPLLVPKLGKKGAFLFAIGAIEDESDIGIIRFLRKYHMMQFDDGVDADASVLDGLLPLPMIRYINRFEPEQFRDVLDGDLQQPDLIWGRELKNRLIESVRRDLAPFVHILRSRPMTLYSYTPPTPVAYPEIDHEACWGGIYLRLLVEQANFELHDPAYAMKGFVAAMASDEMELVDVGRLLLCQKIVCERYPELESCRCYPAFVRLFSMMTREINDDQALLIVDGAVELLQSFLRIETGDNLQAALENGAFVFVSQTLLNVVQHDRELSSLSLKLLQVLNLLAMDNQETLATMHENPQVMTELVSISSGAYAQYHPTLALEVVKLFNCFSMSSLMCQDMLSSGAIVCLLNIAIFFDTNDPLISALVYESAAALKRIQMNGNEDIRRVLRALLTPGLSKRLSDSNDFVAVSRQNCHTPTLIWGSSQRSELSQYIQTQLSVINDSSAWPNWSVEKMLHRFSGLSHEIVAGDIYLRLYNEQEEFVIPNNPDDFLNDLLQCVKAKSKSLLAGECRPDEARAYIEVIAASLRRIIKDNPDLLNTPANNVATATLTEMLDSQNGEVVQLALLVFNVLLQSSSSLPVIVKFSFVFHRLLNWERKDLHSHPDMMLLLKTITQLCKDDPDVASSYYGNGLVVSILSIFADVGKSWPKLRILSAQLLGVLCKSVQMGDAYLDLLCQLLAPTFKHFLLAADNQPEDLIEFFDDEHDTPVVFWTEGCRTDLKVFLKSEMVELCAHQRNALANGASATPFQWSIVRLPERFLQPTLGAQICIDDIYVHAFNANPYFQVRPDKFFTKLVEALYGAFAEYEAYQEDASHQKFLQPTIVNISALWEAVFNLLTNLPHLQDNCVDYLDYIFGYFHPSVDLSLQQLSLNAACLLATNSLCAENMAKLQLIKNIMPLLESLKGKGSVKKVLTFMMDVIRRSSPVVEQIRSSGGVVMLLRIILDNTYTTDERENASMIISAMVQDNVFGSAVADYVANLLTDKFRTIFQARPSKFVQFCDSEHESRKDGRMWNKSTHTDLLHLLKKESEELATAMWYWDGESDVWDVNKLSAVWEIDIQQKEENDLSAEEVPKQAGHEGIDVDDVAADNVDKLASINSQD